MKDGCNCESQRGAEGDEIPQSGKAKNKDQAATKGEHQPWESSPDAKFVHVYAGMATLSHSTPSILKPIIALICPGLKVLDTASLSAIRVVGFWNDLRDHWDDPILSRRDRAGALAAET